MAAGGYVKLWRSIEDWEWYHDLPVRVLFQHLLLKVNWEPKRWQGMTVEPGQLVTSLESLSAGSGLSVKQVRTALEKLKSTGEVGDQTANKFRVVSLRKWAEYQSDDEKVAGKGQAIGKQAASKGQAEGNQRATTKEGEEVEELKKGKKRVAPSAQEPLMMIWPEWAGENTLAKWEAFKAYKAEQHRFKYKGGNSEQAAINMLAKWFTKGKACVEALEEAMARGWMFPVDPGARHTPNGNGHAAPMGYGKAEAEAEMAAIREKNGRDPQWGPVYDGEMSPDLIAYNKALLRTTK